MKSSVIIFLNRYFADDQINEEESERETWKVLKRQIFIENTCLKILKKNEVCNKFGYLKEKYSNESKIKREGYTAFIRSRKE
jgi:hypothetical protein